ncbi:MAG: LysR substrate-binding domain-containing protein [Propionibacteriaceae bacterium]
MHDIARDLHLAFPEASFVCCEIAFDDLNRCLPQERIDVLWTSAEVAHPLVESVPLQVTSGLVGLVADRHPFAAASCVDVTELADRPLLYNPAAPKEWMRPFWLADIRPRRDAQLIPTSGSSHAAATTAAAKEGVAMVTVTMDADIYKPPGTQIISLRHAQRMRMFAARRRTDRRSAVLALIDRFKLLPADTCP